MPVQDFINRCAVSLGYTNKLSGANFVSAAGRSAASGTVDWYTCPAGKRAAILAFSYCTSTGTATITPMFKSGGNYYNMSTAQTVNTLGVATAGVVNQIVLDTGETFSTNQSTNTVNAFISILEFDSDIPLKTIKLLSLSSGNNTLYTCPAGKTAICCSSNLSGGIQSTLLSSNKAINYWNNSGGSRSVGFYHVPNGGSPGSTNQLLQTNPGTVSAGSFSNTIMMNAMNAGDFLVVSTDAATATQWAWVTVMEL